jgi:hypothetical protein
MVHLRAQELKQLLEKAEAAGVVGLHVSLHGTMAHVRRNTSRTIVLNFRCTPSHRLHWGRCR